MVAIWYLLVLAPFVAIPILWWNYRRKIALRESSSRARWTQMVHAPASEGSGISASELAVASPGPTRSVTTVAARCVRRERVLDPMETLVFRLLKTALPEFEIMPHMALSQILVGPPAAAEGGGTHAQAIARLFVDCLICDKNMQPIAAIDLAPPGGTTLPIPAESSKGRYLQDAGIRYLRWPRNGIPNRHSVRELVLRDE